MLTGTAFLIISSGVSLTALGLGTYILAKSQGFLIARVFFAVMVLLASVSTLDFLYISAGDSQTALWYLRFSIFCQVTMYGGFLYIVSFFVIRSEGAVFSRNGKVYLGIVILSGTAAAFLAKVGWSGSGWYYPNSMELVLVGAITFVYLFFALKALNRSFNRPVDKENSIVIASVALAMIVPFIFPLITSVMEVLGTIFPTPMAPSVLLTAMIFSFAIFRSRMFEVVPIKDHPRTDQYHATLSLEPCRSYIIEEKSGELAYRIFTSEVSSGVSGLIITGQHPALVRERYGLTNTPIIWLAHRVGRDSIDPSNLSMLERTVKRFFDEGDHPIVLLDGLDTLAMENRSERALRFLFDLEDSAIMNGGRLIVPVDPDVMSERDLALLIRDMTVIDGKGNRVESNWRSESTEGSSQIPLSPSSLRSV